MSRPKQDTPAANEEKRLAALHALHLLDTPREEGFTELVQLAAEICSTPMCLISLVDRERQWFKATVGCTLSETHRDLSFCAHAIQQPGLFIVRDAAKDPRFQNNALVTGEPGIRFYAGVPLKTRGGEAIGTLCVLDTVPRTLSKTQRGALAVLARQIEAHIDLRARAKAHDEMLAEKQALLESLESSEKLFRAFADNGPGVSFIKDKEGRLVFYNKTFAEVFDINERQWIGLRDDQIWPPEMARKFREADVAVLRRGKPTELIEVSPGRDGRTLKWKSFKFPVFRENGEVMLAGTAIDITAEMERQLALEHSLQEKDDLARDLQASEAIFHSFMEKSPNHAFLKDTEGRYIFYNRVFADHFGIGPRDWIGKTDYEIHPAELADRFRAHDQRVLESGEANVTMHEVVDVHGKTLIFRATKFLIRDAQGRNTLAGLAVNVTEETLRQQALTAANVRLEHLATTDALTGLSNRGVFDTRMAVEFAISTRKRRPLSVVVMDIDNFKQRNDQCGHAAGDDAIRLLGKVLLENVRPGDLAARIGGEEFCCILPDTKPGEARLFAERIQAHLRRLDPGALPLTVSMGIAGIEPTTQTWVRLVAQADDAMYEAKRNGKDRIVLHAEHIQQLMKTMQGSGTALAGGVIDETGLDRQPHGGHTQRRRNGSKAVELIN